MHLRYNYLRYWMMLTLLFIFVVNSVAHAIQLPGPLVDTDWLSNNLDKVVVLDVRTSKASFEKKRRSAEAINPCGVGKKKDAPVIVSGHIPGAVLVAWKDVRENRKINGKELKGLVPSKSAFEKLMQKSGINNDDTAVITGGGQSPTEVLVATRLYWTLKYYGHDNVALHDGGMKDWIINKQEVQYGKSRAKKGNFKAGEPRSELLATTEDAAKAIEDEGIQLVDSRDIEDYLGLTYHRKLARPDRKGHIPSAKMWPITTLVDTKGTATFNSLDEIREVASLMKVDVNKPTITYCWSGAQASLSWFVMHELLGNKNARLYDGSMHEWSQDSNRELATMQID